MGKSFKELELVRSRRLSLRLFFRAGSYDLRSRLTATGKNSYFLQFSLDLHEPF